MKGGEKRRLLRDEAVAGDIRSAMLLDFLHLHRQTAGDDALADELLVLMSNQIKQFCPQLNSGNEDFIRHVAHALKGAARAIGAFAFAAAAEALETAPDDGVRLAAFQAEMARLAAFLDAVPAHDGTETPA